MNRITGAILLLAAAVLYHPDDFEFLIPKPYPAPWTTYFFAMLGLAYLARSWFLPDNIIICCDPSKQEDRETESSRNL